MHFSTSQTAHFWCKFDKFLPSLHVSSVFTGIKYSHPGWSAVESHKFRV